MTVSSDDLHRRALAVMPGGNTRTQMHLPPRPPYIASASGVLLRDADGHEAFDLALNYTTLVHGHGHPAIRVAVDRALAEVVCVGLPTVHQVEHAELLTARVPGLERVRYANSGTEAVMMAIRAARAFTGRSHVIRVDGAYHGAYDLVAPRGTPGASPGLQGESVEIVVGDVEGLQAALARTADRLAGVLLDPMPNRAGLRPLAPEFIQAARDGTRSVGALLIADEVITLRLGVGGMLPRYGVVPDLITMGKVIGGGFAIGAFGGRADVMAVFDPARPDPVQHAGTFTANPVAMRAGIAALELLDATAIERLNDAGDRLRARLADLGFTITGSGSLLRLPAVADSTAHWWALYEAGLAVGSNGLMALATVATDDLLDEVVDRFRTVAPF